MSLQTKNGLTHPGTEVELSAGSFKRVSSELSHGQRIGARQPPLRGRQRVPRRRLARLLRRRACNQLFGKFGSREGALRWDASAAYGTHQDDRQRRRRQSRCWRQRREQVYTVPDETKNDALLITLQGNYKLSDAQSVSATAYVRRVDTDTLNGDLNDAYDPPLVIRVRRREPHREPPARRRPGAAVEPCRMQSTASRWA